MNLKNTYHDSVLPTLISEFEIANKLAAPKISKITVSVALKEAVHDKGVLEKASNQLNEIAGQKAKVTRAKKSIANFKLRENDPVGLTVTLRGKRMWDFATKLLTIVLPRVRDFHGVPLNSFDQSGNYTLGIAEQIVFPEIDYSKIDKIRGLQVTFTIPMGSSVSQIKKGEEPKDSRKAALQISKNRIKIARRMLVLMGMPFEKE